MFNLNSSAPLKVLTTLPFRQDPGCQHDVLPYWWTCPFVNEWYVYHIGRRGLDKSWLLSCFLPAASDCIVFSTWLVCGLVSIERYACIVQELRCRLYVFSWHDAESNIALAVTRIGKWITEINIVPVKAYGYCCSCLHQDLRDLRSQPLKWQGQDLSGNLSSIRTEVAAWLPLFWKRIV